MIPLNLKSGGRVGFKSGSKVKGCKLEKTHQELKQWG